MKLGRRGQGCLIGAFGLLAIETLIAAILFGVIKTKPAKEYLCPVSSSGEPPGPLCSYIAPEAVAERATLSTTNPSTAQPTVNSTFPRKLPSAQEIDSIVDSLLASSRGQAFLRLANKEVADQDPSPAVELSNVLPSDRATSGRPDSVVAGGEDYQQDEAETSEQPSIGFLLRDQGFSRQFKRLSTGLDMDPEVVTPRLQPKPLSNEQTPADFVNKTLCPLDGHLYYFCLKQLSYVDFSDLNCSNFESIVTESFNCCPVLKSHFQSNCTRIKEDPHELTRFMGSSAYVESFIGDRDKRDVINTGYLKAFQLLATKHNVHLEFPVFMTKHGHELVNAETFEHRKFLSDGSVFCYFYNRKTYSGRAKAAACAEPIKLMQLNLTDINNYDKISPNVYQLKLPSWKEYCAQKNVPCV